MKRKRITRYDEEKGQEGKYKAEGERKEQT